MIKLCAFADEAGSELAVQIAALKRNGISLIEVRKVGEKNVSELTDEEAIACREELAKNGIAVWSVGSPLGKVKLAEEKEHMAKVRRVCEIAKLLGTKRIRMFSFFEAYESPAEVKRALAEMVAIADEHGVVLCHENEKDIYGDTLERVLELIDADIKGLRFVFDPANYIQCGEDVAVALDALFDKTDYFHIKDVERATGQLVPAGQGDGEIAKMANMIAASGRDAVMTLEPHLKVFDGYAEIDGSEMKTKFNFASHDESFDAAANALKAVLSSCGYKENEKGEFVK